jgi:hypothetical protein
METTDLRRLREHLGDAALRYILNIDAEDLSARFNDDPTPSDVNRERTLEFLQAVDASFEEEQFTSYNWRAQLSNHSAGSTISFGNSLRQMHDGTVATNPADSSVDSVMHAVIDLAIDAFPSLLVKDGPFGMDLSAGVQPYGTPLAKTAFTAIQEDELFSSIFSRDEEHAGQSSVMLLRSTGQGSPFVYVDLRPTNCHGRLELRQTHCRRSDD